MFGSSGPCTACGQNIPAGEYVMRSSGGNNPQSPGTSPIFHVECFVCSKCQRKLSPGDRYYMYANQLVCEQDWHKMLKTSTATPTVRKGKVGRPRRSRD